MEGSLSAKARLFFLSAIDDPFARLLRKPAQTLLYRPRVVFVKRATELTGGD